MRSALDEFEAEVSSRAESDQSFLNIPWDTVSGVSIVSVSIDYIYLSVFTY